MHYNDFVILFLPLSLFPALSSSLLPSLPPSLLTYTGTRSSVVKQLATAPSSKGPLSSSLPLPSLMSLILNTWTSLLAAATASCNCPSLFGFSFPLVPTRRLKFWRKRLSEVSFWCGVGQPGSRILDCSKWYKPSLYFSSYTSNYREGVRGRGRGREEERKKEGKRERERGRLQCQLQNLNLL